MLAIFDKSVAVCPDNFKKPHPKSVSARKNGFLVNLFLSVYPDSVVSEIGASVVIAYSLSEIEETPRFQFGVERDAFCVYQGNTDNLDFLVNKYFVHSGDDDEIGIIIQALMILRKQNYYTPEHIIRDLLGDSSFIFYDNSSKLLVVTTGVNSEAPLYWGIDSERSLILTDVEELVRKACASTPQPFPDEEVYFSRRGHVGLEAIFHGYSAEVVEQQPLEPEAEHVTAQMITMMTMITNGGDTLDPQMNSWRPPPSPDVFKINTQEMIFHKEKMVGIGVIIRNSHGQMILAGSKKIKGFNSQLLAHQVSTMEGLTLAANAGFKNIIWETVICRREDSEIPQVIKVDMVLLAAKFSSIEFSEVSLNENKAAHGLAEYAKKIEDCIVWVREIPECIASVIEMESSDLSREP